MWIQESPPSIVRIVLIDDHEIFLAGLRLLLRDDPGLVVVGEARNRSEALEAVRTRPDIILLDLDLGPESGTELLPDLLEAAVGARVLVLTGVADTQLHIQAVCLGAMGVVHKLETPSTLLKAIWKVYSGEAWLNRKIVASAMTQLHSRQKNQDPEKEKIASLTAREREVISVLGEGWGTKEIGERLFISEKTVRNYLTSIFNKLEVTDRVELMVFAYQHKLAKVPNQQQGPPLPSGPDPQSLVWR